MFSLLVPAGDVHVISISRLNTGSVGAQVALVLSLDLAP
jgi:hypothetical protein